LTSTFFGVISDVLSCSLFILKIWDWAWPSSPRSLELKIINKTYRHNTWGNTDISSRLTPPYLNHNWGSEKFKYMIYEFDLLNLKRVVIYHRTDGILEKNWSRKIVPFVVLTRLWRGTFEN
jgi:hypothetical protein